MLNITNHQENANQNHNEIYYLIFVDSAVIKKNVNNKYKQECGEKRTLVHCWWETVWRFLKKLKIELPCVHAKSLQLCSTLCDPMDWSLPGSSVHGILQGRILDWVAISYSKGSSQSRDQTRVSCIVGRFFTNWAKREAQRVIHDWATEYTHTNSGDGE